MKKGFLCLSLTALLSVGTLLSAAGCGDSSGVVSVPEKALKFETVYAMAQEAGYTGTMEELIEAFKGAAGEKGEKGDKGDPGADGVGIKDAEINSLGELIITLTDDNRINCGVVVSSSGTTPAPNQALLDELYESISEMTLAGVNFRLEQADAYNDSWTWSTAAGSVAFSDVIEADVYTLSQGSFDADFIRGENLYSASAQTPYGNGGYDESALTPEELLAGIKSGECVLTKNSADKMFGDAQIFQAAVYDPFVLKVLTNLPAVLGGRAVTTVDGYLLTYELSEEIDEVFDKLKSAAAAVDADKSMTVNEVAELPEIKGLLAGLLKGTTAKEVTDFLAKVSEKEFLEIFPEAKAEADGFAYLKACLASPSFGSALGFGGAIGDLNFYDTVCALFYNMNSAGIPDALLPSLENKVETLHGWLLASMGLLDRSVSVTVGFDKNKTPSYIEGEVKACRYPDRYSYSRLMMTATLRADFLSETPELFELSGCKYAVGYTYDDMTETREGSIWVEARHEKSYYESGTTGNRLNELYMDENTLELFYFDSDIVYYISMNHEIEEKLSVDYETGRLYYVDSATGEFVWFDLDKIKALEKFYVDLDSSEFYAIDEKGAICTMTSLDDSSEGTLLYLSGLVYKENGTYYDIGGEKLVERTATWVTETGMHEADFGEYGRYSYSRSDAALFDKYCYYSVSLGGLVVVSEEENGEIRTAFMKLVPVDYVYEKIEEVKTSVEVSVSATVTVENEVAYISVTFEDAGVFSKSFALPYGRYGSWLECELLIDGETYQCYSSIDIDFINFGYDSWSPYIKVLLNDGEVVYDFIIPKSPIVGIIE